jgi:hypothetical protein
LAKTNRTLSILRLTHPYRKPNQKRWEKVSPTLT